MSWRCIKLRPNAQDELLLPAVQGGQELCGPDDLGQIREVLPLEFEQVSVSGDDEARSNSRGRR
jgi:hypothetical protein